MGGAATGVLLAVVAWWTVYAAWRTHASQASTLGSQDDLALHVTRVMVALTALVVAVLAIRWRSVAIGLALGAAAGLALSAFLRFGADGSFFLVGLTSSAPGQGLSSANPVLGALNDLGYAVTEAIFAPPLLLLSSGWLAIALAWALPAPSVRSHEGEDRARRGSARPLMLVAGALLAVGAVLAVFVASRATLLGFAAGRDAWSGLQPAVLLITGTVATLVLMRLPAALVGAALVASIALAASALGLAAAGGPTSAEPIWSFALPDVSSAFGSAAHDAGVLVLFGAWAAGLLGWTLWRARDGHGR